MKSFKKVLCLVLVVVMALGVSTVAFAGNLDKFNDADKAVYPYAEAVDTLIGLKVVNGVSTTELALDQAYTREQAAKVIAYLVLGQKSADALSTTSAPFADVEASRWSAGYIAFCVKQGIIAGYDANTFGPTDGLTGYQFAKMLLTAVGYGKNNEYVGEGWSINVAKDALNLDIFKNDLAAATNAVVTRKQAMLMAFNALTKVPTVNYNANFEAYYTGASFMNGVWEIEEQDSDDDGYAQTLGWKVFGLEIGDSKDDGYGRVGHAWTINNGKTKISGSYADAPDYSYTGKVTEAKLYEDLGKTVAGYTTTVLADGVEKYNTASDPEAPTVLDEFVIRKSNTTAVSGASATLEVYVDTVDKELLIVVVNNYFAQVTDVDEDDETAEFTVFNKVKDGDNWKAEEVPTRIFDTTDFEEDDYAVVNMYYDVDEWVISKAVAAEMVEDVDVSYVASGYIKDGSTTYNKADKLIAEDVGFAVSSKFDLYLDNFGNIIGSVAASDVAANLNYLYVNESKARDAGIDGDAYVKIAADFADGTSKTVNLLVKNPTKSTATVFDPNAEILNDADEVIGYGKYVAVPASSDDFITEGFYSYTVNSDSLYTLKQLSDKASAADTVSFAKASVNITFDGTDTFKATSSTKLLLVEDGTTYTGYKKFPASTDLDLDGVDVRILYVLDKNNNVSTIYIFGESSTKIAPVFGVYNSSEGKDADYFYYKVFVDGILKDFTSETELDFNKGDIVTVEENSKGIATIEAFDNTGDYNDDTAATVDSVDDGYFVADGTVYYFGDSDNEIQIIDYTTSTLKAASTVKKGQTVTVIYDKDDDGTGEYVAVLVVITANA